MNTSEIQIDSQLFSATLPTFYDEMVVLLESVSIDTNRTSVNSLVGLLQIVKPENNQQSCYLQCVHGVYIRRYHTAIDLHNFEHWALILHWPWSMKCSGFRLLHRFSIDKSIPRLLQESTLLCRAWSPLHSLRTLWITFVNDLLMKWLQCILKPCKKSKKIPLLLKSYWQFHSSEPSVQSNSSSHTNLISMHSSLRAQWNSFSEHWIRGRRNSWGGGYSVRKVQVSGKHHHHTKLLFRHRGNNIKNTVPWYRSIRSRTYCCAIPLEQMYNPASASLTSGILKTPSGSSWALDGRSPLSRLHSKNSLFQSWCYKD